MHVLDVRHPGLREKMHRMFEEFWPTPEVKHMLQTHYGERLSLRSIERYKSQVIGSSAHRLIDPSEEQKRDQPMIRWAEGKMNRFSGPMNR
jgi:hypothetical protein